MTRNVYVGVDALRIVLDSSPLGVEEAFAIVERTNFSERARWLAAEIADELPDLVGLQEVALWRSQTPGDYSRRNPKVNASTIEFDYLEILLDRLSDLGCNYVPLVVCSTFDAELAGIGRDLRLTDREVLLMRAGVPAEHLEVLRVNAGRFRSAVQLPIDRRLVPLWRGWVGADLRVRRRPLRVISTHLETNFVATQLAQAQELLWGPASTNTPTILLGDFNSSDLGDGAPTPTYPALAAAGFEDAWKATSAPGKGFTCCQNELLDNPASLLDARIDLVLFRSSSKARLRRKRDLRALQAFITGHLSVPVGQNVFWASDHAGVVADFQNDD
jgi:endonuclease/exonuclease/phosphatase family metal-dependent hydrolase